jgi:hypothetical protein
MLESASPYMVSSKNQAINNIYKLLSLLLDYTQLWVPFIAFLQSLVITWDNLFWGQGINARLTVLNLIHMLPEKEMTINCGNPIIAFL